MNARGSKRLFPFIFQSISPFKSYLIFSVFVSIIGAVDLSLRPYFLKMALDSAKLQDKLEYNEKFLTYIFLYLISMSVMFAVNTVYEYMWIDFFPRFRRSIGNLVFQELIEQSYTFYQNNFLGSLGQRLNNCIGPIPRIIKALNEDFFKNTLAIAISVYALGYISFKYSAALIIWASIYICCAVILSSRVKEKSIITAKEASRGMGYIIDVLNNMMSIKLFHGKAFETEKVDENFKEWEKCVKSRDILLVHLNTFQTITFFIFQAVCIYWMIETDVKTNKITPGDLVLFFSISFSIYNSLIGLSRTIADYSENLGIVTEALSIIFSFKEIRDKEDARILNCTRGKIVFDRVKFHYKGTEPLFRDKSVRNRGGTKSRLGRLFGRRENDVR